MSNTDIGPIPIFDSSGRRVIGTEWPSPQESREHIPDPTVKTNLPKNLLAALGNAHVNLQFQVNKLALLLDNIGWPEGETIHDYDVIGPPLSTALDYARENARLTWVICGMTDALDLSLGKIIWTPEGEIACVGDECEHNLGPQIMTGTQRNGQAISFYPVERVRPAAPPGAPRPVSPNDPMGWTIED